jgi:hypothetical protein
MSLATLTFLLKVVILASALVALAFGVAFMFFYERFQIFNELVNSQYLVKNKGYQGGKGYLIDNWVMGWHTLIGFVVLLVSAWLFWVFFTYMAL